MHPFGDATARKAARAIGTITQMMPRPIGQVVPFAAKKANQVADVVKAIAQEVAPMA